MISVRKRLPSWTGAALVGAAYSLFSWAALSRQYTFDAISYLWDVEHTHLAIPFDSSSVAYNFFHSQHLLFSSTVYFFYHSWIAFGYNGSALLPAQMLNILEGGVTLGLVFG